MSSWAAWNQPDTVRYFEEFCRRHARYRNANRKLIRKARIGGSQKILDFAAGTGRTAEAALAFLGSGGSILCIEPADAMRLAGTERLPDPRVCWAAEMPDEARGWDRILCGAAIWQLEPLQEWLCRFARILRPEGAFCFNIPSLYLGEGEQPGGGEDPQLMLLPALLYEKRTSAPPQTRGSIRTAPEIDAMLQTAGLVPQRWSVRTRLGYTAYRDWLKIPVNTEGLFAGVPADERAAIIDEAFEKVDARSWRRENWTGWTAWKK